MHTLIILALDDICAVVTHQAYIASGIGYTLILKRVPVCC